MAGDVVRLRVIVQGKVQGVFFRDSTRDQAERHGVTGWVCNRSDGAVEAVLEGTREAVQQVLDFLESGPPRARVEHLDVRDEEPEGARGFEVR